jgi:hypothetical protein
LGFPLAHFPWNGRLNPNLIFLSIKTPCKISEPYNNPFWEKSNPAERRENNGIDSGHLVPKYQ